MAVTFSRKHIENYNNKFLKSHERKIYECYDEKREMTFFYVHNVLMQMPREIYDHKAISDDNKKRRLISRKKDTAGNFNSEDNFFEIIPESIPKSKRKHSDEEKTKKKKKKPKQKESNTTDDEFKRLDSVFACKKCSKKMNENKHLSSNEFFIMSLFHIHKKSHL